MFKNVLLGFSLLCGFLLPNHINAFSTQIPAVYSWETGDSDASAIVMPPLPAGYTIGVITSVAINADGNAVMAGKAEKADFSDDIPIAYRLAYGETAATPITLPTLPDGYTSGSITSVAIDAAGNAIMVGHAGNAISPGSPPFLPLAYSWTDGATEAKEITLPPLPGGTLAGILYSVAIDAAGNAVIVGEGDGAEMAAYKLVPGAIKATLITVAPPSGEKESRLWSVAITADGKAIMVGAQGSIDSNTIPLAYSWNTGDAAASQITTALPAEHPRGSLSSVAINTAGNAVMVGYARTADITALTPLTYSWNTGDAAASQITTALPTGSTAGEIKSVAINDAGNAVMGGYARTADITALTPLTYSWNTGDPAASQITTALPTGYPYGSLNSVAINADGNAVMGGYATNADGDQPPLAYSWKTGDASAIETPPPYHEYPAGALDSVAINADGKAIMGGRAIFAAPNTGAAFPGGDFTQPPLQ